MPYGLKISSLFQHDEIPAWKPFRWKNLEFKNPLGLAGGVDKNGESVEDWWAHGAGFVEVGTVTPRPQTANSGRILSRDYKTLSLWNRMGFPSHGALEVLAPNVFKSSLMGGGGDAVGTVIDLDDSPLSGYDDMQVEQAVSGNGRLDYNHVAGGANW